MGLKLKIWHLKIRICDPDPPELGHRFDHPIPSESKCRLGVFQNSKAQIRILQLLHNIAQQSDKDDHSRPQTDSPDLSPLKQPDEPAGRSVRHTFTEGLLINKNNTILTKPPHPSK